MIGYGNTRNAVFFADIVGAATTASERADKISWPAIANRGPRLHDWWTKSPAPPDPGEPLMHVSELGTWTDIKPAEAKELSAYEAMEHELKIFQADAVQAKADYSAGEEIARRNAERHRTSWEDFKARVRLTPGFAAAPDVVEAALKKVEVAQARRVEALQQQRGEEQRRTRFGERLSEVRELRKIVANNPRCDVWKKILEIDYADMKDSV